MKKILLLTIAILMTSNLALACGGIIIKNKYCLSKHTMNWYSASAWCQAQGMNLVDVKEECQSLSYCHALKLSSAEQEQVIAAGGKVNMGWTNTSSTNIIVYSIVLSSGTVTASAYRNNHYTDRYALCK